MIHAEHTSDAEALSQSPDILVVDDEEIILQLVGDILTDEGYMVACARNGAEAFDQAQKLRPRLILTDAMMPRMSGFELCEKLRLDQRLHGVPVVLMTAMQSLLPAQLTHFHGVLYKPFDLMHLLATIETHARF